MEFASHEFWIAVTQIIAIDLVLSGDNAVVIALACRNLPPDQRRKGILFGVAGAVALRVVLTAFAAGLMGFPWLKLIGGVLLLWIGTKLLLPEEGEGPDIAPADHLWGAIKTIVVADFVMSLDNVIGVAGAARDSVALLIFGLAVSIPLIIWSSQLILRFMERFPVVVTLGAGLLGYVAGGMMAADPALRDWVNGLFPGASTAAAVAGALFVVVTGTWLARRKAMEEGRKVL
ncbi:MAG: TerC family protein [Rhodocyclaceae bacterium]|nr:TerC family protein [Rhodocyclaceae bacterium]